ncbi:MAG TPA: acetyl-CoA C-acetyltransferase [Halieaceae bacterium]|jgi:acetyl-CoA C-acetyltransferase|uniref:acetyl-CoA C-acyltransferase n=1 Tax=Haliea TaxID=475794 RepID=UPI000C5194B7|nr:acetyl-CoA C-acyltransferase [Haliea sp.]HBQ41911.1 acetyl-CoA C-acetyltransferase [Halieaceae bacterium]MAD64883.1 acetyl-CoA C-acyltransferase [Haliea sp.]MAY94668.1 acetyl-CoA C-acyltransferase [Haliea sp.]MBP71672.1 acetyl-CoA C-acyltransferase [Haliea sp.]HCD54787.1 acetyl-CoA C-acetyltransferase [Halieaceae bacterium]|tara:strand:+ start:10714 stop:11895 length:1182 start_codon:yes stop_codon:yes gene_type:complete
MSKESVVIVNGARTPMGGLQGSLAALTAAQLGSTAIAAALERSGVEASAIDEIFMGCVLPGGLKQGPARQAARGAGIPDAAGAVTLNKLCGSGMQATIFGFDSIAAGTNQAVVCGGMESMSNAPHLIPGARGGVRTGHAKLLDHMFVDGLEDADTGRAMGSFAQETANQRGLTREQMDAFAVESLTRAKRAIEDGSLQAETAPVTVSGRKGDTVVSDDEQPHKAALEKIPNLRPAFAADGTITAANSSSISDGASALVLMNESAAEAQGLKPMARIVAHARHSQHPSEFTIAPIGAMEKLLAKTGWGIDEIDLFEINEAFAMVTMLAISDLGLDHSKVNIHGGACAQGHPIGSTGSRIIVSLMYALQKLGKQRGVAALCIGGGEATAVAIEMI